MVSAVKDSVGTVDEGATAELMDRSPPFYRFLSTNCPREDVRFIATIEWTLNF